MLNPNMGWDELSKQPYVPPVYHTPGTPEFEARKAELQAKMDVGIGHEMGEHFHYFVNTMHEWPVASC